MPDFFIAWCVKFLIEHYIHLALINFFIVWFSSCWFIFSISCWRCDIVSGCWTNTIIISKWCIVKAYLINNTLPLSIKCNFKSTTLNCSIFNPVTITVCWSVEVWFSNLETSCIGIFKSSFKFIKIVVCNNLTISSKYWLIKHWIIERSHIWTINHLKVSIDCVMSNIIISTCICCIRVKQVNACSIIFDIRVNSVYSISIFVVIIYIVVIKASHKEVLRFHSLGICIPTNPQIAELFNNNIC